MTSPIFISYSKYDQKDVDRFYEILTKYLFCDIFKADKNLPIAKDYEKELKDQIKQCGILIRLFLKNSIHQHMQIKK